MKLTYFVHSTTLDNEADLATGWQDSPLSSKGRQQARELHDAVFRSCFDAVYASDSGRALDTAITVFEPEAPIRQDKRLREIHYGRFSKRPSALVKRDLAKYIAHPFPEGESYKDVEKRLHDFLNDLKQAHATGSTIAIVAHQAPQLALEVLLLGKTWEQAFRDDWRNTHAWQPGWCYET